MPQPKSVKNCRVEKDKQGKCRQVCEDENGKTVWRHVDDKLCEGQ